MEKAPIPPFQTAYEPKIGPGIGTSMRKRMQEILEQWQKEVGEEVVDQAKLQGRLRAYNNLLAMEAPDSARSKMLTAMRAQVLEKLDQYQ